MSFHLSFSAKTVQGARQKLHDSHAPITVKALIEKALDGITPSIASGSGSGTVQQLHGILVETFGHIGETGGTSEIEKFVVRPLYE